MVSGLLGLIWVYALLIAGDVGENLYGAPFGETADTARQKRADQIRVRVRAEFGDGARPTSSRPGLAPKGGLGRN